MDSLLRKELIVLDLRAAKFDNAGTKEHLHKHNLSSLLHILPGQKSSSVSILS